MKNRTGDITTNIDAIVCDLQDFESVQSAVTIIKNKYDSIDVLCNKCGCYGSFEDKPTKDGYDVQMQVSFFSPDFHNFIVCLTFDTQPKKKKYKKKTGIKNTSKKKKTNHLSHFLLTKELFPLLQKAKQLRGEARIVHHSSGARHGQPGLGGKDLKAEYFEKKGGQLGGNGASMIGGARWQRYHQTKLANSVFTHALSLKLKDTGIKATVAAPGLAATNLQVNTGEGMGGNFWIMHMSQSAEDGAMPLLASCFDPSTENGDFWEPNGFANMRGPATKVKWDSLSLKQENSKLLWEKSEEACGKFNI